MSDDRAPSAKLRELLQRLDEIGDPRSGLHEGGSHSTIHVSKSEARDLALEIRVLRDEAWRFRNPI